MNGLAAGLEIGTLALAVAVLALDLIAPSREPSAKRTALFGIAAFGIAGLLAWSFRLPVPAELTRAFVQDPFAMLVKRVLLGAAFLAVVGMAPYAAARRVADRAGETIVLILFATAGGMALVSARESLTLFVAFELLSL